MPRHGKIDLMILLFATAWGGCNQGMPNMSTKSKITLFSSTICCVIACMNWNGVILFQHGTVGFVLVVLVLFETGWLWSNVTGILACVRASAVKESYSGIIVEIMPFFFAVMIVFQFLFLFRQLMNLGREMAG